MREHATVREEPQRPLAEVLGEQQGTARCRTV
jgi:hypothetical protein